MKALFLLLALISITSSQNSTCYSNCKLGYCDPTNALSCSDCDLGLVNINNACIGTSTLSPPITYLRPQAITTLTDATSPINCSITNSIQGKQTQMAFQPTIGSTFTRQFSIPYNHVFLQIKFNSIVAGVGREPSFSTLLINFFTPSGTNIFSTVKTTATPGNPVRCSENYQATDVFQVNEKRVSSDSSVLVEVRASGAADSKIALSAFEVFFGNCSMECEECFGPTNQECNTCRGLLTTITNSQCSGCPEGYYLNKICLPCPIQCQKCALQGVQVVCSQCNPTIAFSVTEDVSPSLCKTNYSLISNADKQNFQSTDWKSTQSAGNIVTTCGFYSLIGGISIGVTGSSLYKIFNDLPAHSTMFLYFTLFFIDQSLGDFSGYQIKVDDVLQNPNFTITTSAGATLTNECGNKGSEFVRRQFLTFSHNASTATVRLSFLKDYAGIRDIFLLVNNKTSVKDCYSQQNGSCSACRNGFALVNNTCSTCAEGYYLSNDHCEVCPIACSACQTTSNRIKCTSCYPPLKLEDGYCVDVSSALISVDIVDGVSSQEDSKWKLYPNLQDGGIDSCGNQSMLGSSDIRFKFLSMNRTFTGLPSHTGVVLLFYFYQIDELDPDSIHFTLDSVDTAYQLSPLRMNLCGNASADAKVPIRLVRQLHTKSTLDFRVRINSMGKFGISNVMLYLLGTKEEKDPFQIQIATVYSVTTPPVKGLTVKLIFPKDFYNSTSTDEIFTFTSSKINTSKRLLQNNSQAIYVHNSTQFSNRQALYFINMPQDLINQQLSVRATNPSGLYFLDDSGNRQTLSQRTVSQPIPRYIDIDMVDVDDRSTLRNLYNLFRGCAILGLFIGLASFLVGMSAAFDDFLLLCQLIFVHVFIMLRDSPPSVRVPFDGLSIVQFLAWLPWPARVNIEKAIIPKDYYQYSPIVYQQYYYDIIFARTIYQTIIFFAVVFLFWAILHIILAVLGAKNSNVKYTNYIVHYYYSYDFKKAVFIDKIVRFAYFTVVWACVLQFTHLKNQPQSFFAWNTALTIIFAIAAVAYPFLFFWYIKTTASTLSDNTFNKNYEQLRVSSQKLYYFLLRYIKLIIIACVIGFCWDASPVIAPIILIVLNLADAALIQFTKPLGMAQSELLQAKSFYPHYPTVYRVTSILQQLLFVILQILFLIMYGLRGDSTSGVYMGIGYAICAFVIILLLNGLLRLFWGFMKLVQHCHLQRQAFTQSVDKQLELNKDPAEHHQMADNLAKSQANNLSRRDLSRLQSKKMSYVSKLR